jgi:uncharacterized protein (DUF2267 family)
MTPSLDLSQQEEKSIQFFREIKHDLGSSSMIKIVKLVRVVLSQIRKSLSHEQATIFIKSLPSVFQLLFIANWKYNESNAEAGSIRHLDELIDTLYEQDQKSGACLFHTEIDTLNTVILILTKLDKFFGAMGLKIFQHSLTEELRQAASPNVA